MPNDEAKLTIPPRRLLTLIILLPVMRWYDRKISRIGEQEFGKNISANSFNNPNHY